MIKVSAHAHTMSASSLTVPFSLVVTAVALAVFLLVFWLTPVGAPDGAHVLPEQIASLGIVDTRPQWRAYLAVLAWLGVAFALSPLIAAPVERMASGLPAPTAIVRLLSKCADFLCAAGANIRLRRVIARIAYAAAAVCLAITAYMFAFHFNDFTVNGTEGMDSADFHTFSGFLEFGDQLWRFGKILPDHTIGYGIGLPIGYALVKSLFPDGALALAFGLVRFGNWLFLFAWGSAIWFAGRKLFGLQAARWLVVALFVVYGTQMLLLPYSVSVTHSMMSGWRFLPFAISFLYFAYAADRTSYPQFALAGALGALMAAAVPETGTIAGLAICAFCMSSRKVGLNFFAAGALYFIVFVGLICVLFASCDAVFGSRLLASLSAVSTNLAAGYGGLRVRFAPLNLIMALHAIYVIAELSARLHRRALEGDERFRLGAALILLGWFSYFIYRPFPPYAWIYFFLYVFLLLPHLKAVESFVKGAAPDVHKAISVVLVIFLIAVGLSPLHGTLYRLMRDAEHEVARGQIGGVVTEKEWADRGAMRIRELTQILSDSAPTVIVSNHATQIAALLPRNAGFEELFSIAFVFSTFDQVRMFTPHITKTGTKRVVFDQPDTSKSSAETMWRLEAAMPPTFHLTTQTANWRVWRRD